MALPKLAPTGQISAERRQLTMMFCDVVGSTALSEQLDPEDFFRIIRAYQDECTEQATRLGGHLARSFGDGLLFYFGFPHAHEDDPARAVRAALSIIADFTNRSFVVGRQERISLAVRVAVHTGEVVVGALREGDAWDQVEVFGTTANVAARLQQAASPNTVLIGTLTHDLVRGVFRCRYAGAHRIKGLTGAVKSWQVETEIDAESRFDQTRAAVLSPIVGREAEVSQLIELWDRATRGEGRLVQVSGEPGIGKSRLVRALREALDDRRHVTLFYQCSPLHTNTPLYPMIEQVRRASGLRPDDKPRAALKKLEAMFGLATDRAQIAVPYYATFLSIAKSAGYQPVDLSTPGQREKALEVFASLPVELSSRMPVLMIIEDAHWIDPTSLELLRRLRGHLPGKRVLVIVTYRPNVLALLEDEPHDALVTVGRLDRRDTESLISAVAGNAALPRYLIKRIVDRTDGVPLFVEEVTKAIVEAGHSQDTGVSVAPSGSLTTPSVPTTIHDSLMERLDRLGPAKQVVQVAAVIGRHFDFRTLQHLCAVPGAALHDALRSLEVAGLIRPRGEMAETGYSFKHAMVQEAAYGSILKNERAHLHQRVADQIRQRSKSRDSGELAELAYHCSKAGLIREATASWLEAGKRALLRSANKEAIAHLSEGLTLVSRLPPTTSRHRQEIELQSNLAMAYMALEGWAGPHVERAYQRALELSRAFGTSRQQSVALWGISQVKLVGTDLLRSMEYAREFIGLADAADDMGIKLMAHSASLTSNFFLGHLKTALRHAEFVLANYDPRRHRRLVEIYQHDPNLVALEYLGHIYWLLGRPQEAAACCRKARSQAEKLGHPFMRAFALILGSSDHLYERDFAAHLDCIQKGVRIAKENGITIYEVFGPLWATEALMARDASRGTVDRLADLIETLLKFDCYLQAPLYQILLAGAYNTIGDNAKARLLARSAEALMRRTKERWFAPEVYRIHGGLLLGGDAPDRRGAEGCFRRSLASARRMGAVGWELRTVIDLARLSIDEGDPKKAKGLLTRISRKYAAHESCADLRTARTLLNAVMM